MCGICGFNFNDKKLMGEMCEIIAHRGPNSQGIYVDEGISLGNRRLSIIDVSDRGKMPMSNADGTLVITYNGEIYNFKEIKKDLEVKGHRFRSNTDTEVILYAYQEYGSECIKLLNGIFAFAIWDSKNKSLFLARDHVGIKPLYYYFDNKRLIFASEIKAILLDRSIKRKMNAKVLKEIVQYAYPISGGTLFEGINELKPGHTLLLSKNKIITNSYWNPKIKELNRPFDYFIKKTKALIEDSVRMQLVSDVPLGVFLSGGIDSSLIAAVASKYLDKLKTVTLGFDEENDEYKYARIVAEHCNTDHSEIHITSEHLIKAIPKIIWHYELPFSRPAILAYYFLSNKTKGELTVSLLGQGADEVFAGYDRYDAYSELPKNEGIYANKHQSFYEGLKQKINMSPEEKTKYLSSGVFKNDAGEIFREDLAKDSLNSDYAACINGLKNNGSQLNPTLLYEIKTELPYYQLKMVDKTSMANSHEMRVPFLDRRLIEFSLSMPGKFKFYGLDKKLVLKSVAKDYLPDPIMQRRKLPMVVPLSNFHKNFVDSAAQLLENKKFRDLGFYKSGAIARKMESFKNGKLKTDNSYRQLLFFVTLGLWADIFINGEITKDFRLNLNKYI